MFNRNSAFFCLLTIFACCSSSCADVPLESTEGRILGGGNPGANSNVRTVASIRLRTTQMSYHTCGAFIINKHWVGTAGQCMAEKTENNTVVAVGSTSIVAGTIYDINRIETHVDFNALTLVNDIALVRTLNAIIFATNVQPIPLGNRIIEANMLLSIYGWGRTTAVGNSSPNLLTATFTVVLHATCLARFPYVTRAYITDRHICMSSALLATCPGDAGGPIIFNDAVVGIISWVEPCVAGQTNVNTRISSYANWIVGFTRDDD